MLQHRTDWAGWVIKTSSLSTLKEKTPNLPAGFTVARVPKDQLDLVISTSTIPRQKATLLLQPNLGILNSSGALVAWGYVGIDGSIATLFVLEEYRGRGFAKYVAAEMVGRYGRGDFKDLGYDGRTGWVHSDVKRGNEGSEGVMKALGGEVRWEASYVWLDGAKIENVC